MNRNRSILVVFWALALGACTPVVRDNPYDPGATSNFKPHFRQVARVESFSNANGFWLGSDSLYLRGDAGNGTNYLARVGLDGSTIKVTNGYFPTGPYPAWIQGWDGNGQTTLILATNNSFVFLNSEFTVLSNAPGIAGNSPANGFLVPPGPVLETVFINTMMGSQRLFRPGYFNLVSFPMNLNYDLYFGVQMNAAGSAPEAFLVSGRGSGGNGEFRGLYVYHAETGVLLRSNLFYYGTNMDGFEVSSFSEAKGYGNNILARVYATGGHQFLRWSSGSGFQVMILDPEPPITETYYSTEGTWGINPGGYLVIRRSSAYLIYKATGN